MTLWECPECGGSVYIESGQLMRFHDYKRCPHCTYKITSTSYLKQVGDPDPEFRTAIPNYVIVAFWLVFFAIIIGVKWMWNE